MEANIMATLVRPHSPFDNFLFANVIENDTQPVTVISMLSRLGLDPWVEASRLSQLPKRQALVSFSKTIRKCECQSIPASNADEIAAGLIDYLPSREQLVVEATHQESANLATMWLIFAIFLGMMAITPKNVPGSSKENPPQAMSTQASDPSAFDFNRKR
jgi:hypothetical protein